MRAPGSRIPLAHAGFIHAGGVRVGVLGHAKLVAFAPTTDAKKCRAFYEGALGLRFVQDDGFALVFDANGTTLRIAKGKPGSVKPAPFTILGWHVDEIDAVVDGLAKRGVTFEMYGFPEQDARGIWASPSGARVAWFKDPDGNVLSVSTG